MFQVVIGHSNDPDSQEAVAEVLSDCLDSLAGEIPQAGILFAAMDFDHSLILEQICQQFPDLELIGGTTDGEISSQLGFQQDSLILILFCSDEIAIYAGLGQEISRNPLGAVQQAVNQAQEKILKKPSLCLTFSEGLSSFGSQVVEALKQELGKSTPIFGGLTAENAQFKGTYQFYKTQVFHNSIVLLNFTGKLLISYGIAKGWNPLSKKGKVTKVDNNIVYEINNKPAQSFYQYYLDKIYSSWEYPLAVFHKDTDSFYMRVPFSYDEKIGSVTFFEQIPEGATVQIFATHREELITSCQDSIRHALKTYSGQEPSLALFFSCATRKNILGTKADQEYQAVSSFISKNLPSCGFYTYGEIAPLENYQETFLHHETFITLLLGTR